MKTPLNAQENRSKIIEETPALARLLNKMEPQVARSFTESQLLGLQKVVSERGWKGHSLDLRPTLFLPLLPWSFYIVFLFGVNRRHLSSSEKTFAAILFLLMLTLLGMSILGFALVLLYLIKSALGIDLFPNESFGLWDEVKRWFES